MTIAYEWDFETVDKHDDIIDHNHTDKLGQYHKPSDIYSSSDETVRLALVRDVGNEWEGLTDRAWAYAFKSVDDVWILPEEFSDALGAEVARVPKRFHTELAKWQAAHVLTLAECIARNRASVIAHLEK